MVRRTDDTVQNEVSGHLSRAHTSGSERKIAIEFVPLPSVSTCGIAGKMRDMLGLPDMNLPNHEDVSWERDRNIGHRWVRR